VDAKWFYLLLYSIALRTLSLVPLSIFTTSTPNAQTALQAIDLDKSPILVIKSLNDKQLYICS